MLLAPIHSTPPHSTLPPPGVLESNPADPPAALLLATSMYADSGINLAAKICQNKGPKQTDDEAFKEFVAKYHLTFI